MQETKYRLKMVIEKKGTMRYFSQLDLVKVFERSLRRSNLPLYFTKGFSPRVKMSFSNALKLGVEGTITVTFYFTEKVSPEAIDSQLKPHLPDGIGVVSVATLDA